ncbi:MAG: hypothetical protein ACXWUG_26085 [Polyangiales bacterium]
MLPSLRERLAAAPSGLPIVLGPSLAEVLQDDGEALAHALRRRADAVIATQRAVVEAGAEIILAPTACTTASALHATGQAYRAAALTAVAVDLSRNAVLAAARDTYVVGEVPAFSGNRAENEARAHVERLVTAGADGLLVIVEDPKATRMVAETAAAHGILAIAEVDVARLAMVEGPFAGMVVRCAKVEEIPAALEAARAHSRVVGVRIMVSDESAQLVVARAWGVMASLGVSFLAVGGAAALTTLPALVDLARAPRVSVV